MSRLTEMERQKLLSTKTEDEWNATCNEIKASNGGEYPDEWGEDVIYNLDFVVHREKIAPYHLPLKFLPLQRPEEEMQKWN